MVLTKPEPVKTVLTKLELVEMVHRNLVLTNPPKQVHVETALPNFEPVIDKKKKTQSGYIVKKITNQLN